MFASVANFFEAAQPFIQMFNTWNQKMHPSAIADHICYKCADSTEFERMRALFESTSGFVYQSIIAGRRIAIIKFAQPINTELGDIWFLELSDQKPDGSQASGFDHIEIFPVSGSMDELAADLELQGEHFEKVIRPHHTTYDATIGGAFKIRLEPEALIEKIKANELR